MPGPLSLTPLLPSGKAALRLAAGTASLAAGGWALRALREAPAALGAGPAAIRAACAGSPNYRGGVFHNLEPSSALRLDVEENQARRLLNDLDSFRIKVGLGTADEDRLELRLRELLPGG